MILNLSKAILPLSWFSLIINLIFSECCSQKIPEVIPYLLTNLLSLTIPAIKALGLYVDISLSSSPVCDNITANLNFPSFSF